MELRDKLAAIMALCLPAGFQIIGAYSNGPRPEKEYAALDIQGLETLPVHREETDADGNRTLSRHQTFELRLNIYGKACLQLADRAAMHLETDAVLALTEQLEVSWSTEPKTDNVPALMDDMSYEPRALLRIEGQHTLVITEQVSFIDTVNMTGATEGTAYPTTAEFTANVNDAI